MKKSGLLLSLCLITVALSAQKVPIDQNVYDSWRSIGPSSISDDGKWISWELNPQQGDGWLFLHNVLSDETDSAFCGYKATYSPGCKYFVYQGDQD